MNTVDRQARLIAARLARIALLAVVACLAAALPALPAFAVAPLVSATLQPDSITLGDSAQLTITSSGNGMDQLMLPQVAGLDFRVVGQSRRIEIINGATLATTSIMVRVTPQVAGIFTIPGITPKSQPLVLRVSPDNGSGGTPQSGNSRSPLRPPVNAGSAAANGIRLTADGSAFVKLTLPKHEVYVGESMPVDIEVGMRSGFVTSLNGLPTLKGGEFTLNNLSRQPERVEKLIDGQPFVLLTWHSVLAPVKPGTFTVSVESPLTVRIRTRPPRDSMIDDMLGDPFLQNFFGATVSKDITVASPTTELTVLALPTEGRPPDFSGAVGTFKIAGELPSSGAAVGDPLTLRMKVIGSGNFDRVDSPMLEHVDQWKTYPPKSTFAPGDTLGYKGEKTFEQPLIASRPGPQTLPPLTFSYFDPNTRRYETARSTPLNVTISPSLADSTPPAPPSPQVTAAAPASPAQNGWRPDHVAVGSSTDTLVPLYLQPRFLALSSLLALAFSGGWLALRRRAAAEAAPRVRELTLSKSAGRVLQQMAAAARAGDSKLFSNTARAGLQQRLAARWQLPPELVTTAEVDARLGNDGGNGRDIRRIFALTDEINYSGRALTTSDFEHWTELVRRQLADDLSS